MDLVWRLFRAPIGKSSQMRMFRHLRMFLVFIVSYWVALNHGSIFLSANPPVPITPATRTLFSKTGTVWTRQHISQLLGRANLFPSLPQSIEVVEGPHASVKRFQLQYTLDTHLQKTMEKWFAAYRPDHGALVALDPATGQILAFISYAGGTIQHRGYSDAKHMRGHLALRASYPSASVFKVVTAAAAIENYRIAPNTVIPFNGRKHTLYRNQILKSQITRWTRFITFKQAFAHSINTVFGRMGAYTIGADTLREYAERFGFNRSIESDLPMQEGHAFIPSDPWGLAESASGFTRDNTMSPLQGALIAATVVNGGVMMEPYVVQSVFNEERELLYDATPRASRVVTTGSTAREIRTLMKETVLRGTSRSSFRGFFRKELVGVEVGAKTGSLTGTEPPGKYDWFVGYGAASSHRIALAVLTIHKKQWRVKSSHLARLAIESYFKDYFRTLKAVQTVVRQ